MRGVREGIGEVSYLRDEIERLVDEQGWNEDSLVGLLVEAIEGAHAQEAVIRSLQVIADEENAESSDDFMRADEEEDDEGSEG